MYYVLSTIRILFCYESNFSVKFSIYLIEKLIRKMLQVYGKTKLLQVNLRLVKLLERQVKSNLSYLTKSLNDSV